MANSKVVYSSQESTTSIAASGLSATKDETQCSSDLETESEHRENRLGIEYSHTKPQIPEVIVLLLKPIYARLGSPLLLQKCLQGYTQNANEALHSTVRKLCPKDLVLGKESVDINCSITVCGFNDGACALLSLSNSLHLISACAQKERQIACAKIEIQVE